MLTTTDLYKRPEYNFEIDDLVKFQLLRGYKLRICDNGYYKSGIIEKSKNKNSNQIIIGTITDYRPDKINDLKIELISSKNKLEVSLKLSQCKALKVLD